MSTRNRNLEPPRFTLDALTESDDTPWWPAVRYGKPWNGWATPVVSRDVCEAALGCVGKETGEPHHWDGDVVVASGPLDGEPEPEYWDRIEPADDGTYDLGLLGWTWVTEAREGA